MGELISRRGDGVRAVLAAVLSAGAAVVHIAAAIPHLSDSLLLGLGFLTVGWAQLILAGVLVRRDAPRTILYAGVALHFLALATWALSRTAGLPLGHSGPEPLGIADGITAAFELGAVALIARSLTSRPVSTGRVRTVLATAGAAVILTMTASGIAVASLAGGGGHHDARSHGDPATPGHSGEDAMADDATGEPSPHGTAGWRSPARSPARSHDAPGEPQHDEMPTAPRGTPTLPQTEHGHTHPPGEGH